MINIPGSNRQFQQPNTSNRFGNIWYTKNMNFDEKGYAKLASRVVALQNEKNDADFDLPVGYGRTDNADFWVVTTDRPWIFEVDPTNISSAEDTDNTEDPVPDLNSGSFGTWWNNRWYVSTNEGTDRLYYRDSAGWTDTGVTMSGSTAHPIEVFRTKDNLALGIGNNIRLIDSSHATTITGTIPEDYETIGLSFSNGRMAIATRLSDDAQGQNQNAYMFVWDGSTNQVNSGYDSGSDAILGICAYKSSWAILTRNGQLQYFNGGGFEVLATLPYQFVNLFLGNSSIRNTFGNIIFANGNKLYINISNNLNSFGSYNERYIQQYLGGILCYDPAVGIYHRYSPSLSPITSQQILSSSVNITTNTITSPATVPPTGSMTMQTSPGTTPVGGLSIGFVYYIIKTGANTFQLATSKENALSGIPIDLTSQGDLINYFVFLEIIDYGASLTGNFSGAIGQVENGTQLYDDIFFGFQMRDFDSQSLYAVGCMTVPVLPNIGYFVTPKIESNQIEDVYNRVIVKYKPLNTSEKIIIKYKFQDIVGIPVSTPQSGTTACTWTGTNVFTTTADLSAAMSYLAGTELNPECECEIISGAGAGQMSQITSITYNAGTYTVTLDEDIDGAVAARVCNIIINNWKKLGEITSDDTMGHKEFAIAMNSKFVMFKVELRGVAITIEDLIVGNKTQLPVG